MEPIESFSSKQNKWKRCGGFLVMMELMETEVRECLESKELIKIMELAKGKQLI